MFDPIYRPRRLRSNPVLRDLVQETRLSMNDFVLPLFIAEGKGIKKPIASLPGHFQISVDQISAELQDCKAHGIRSVLLFGIPNHKDEVGSSAWQENGVINQAIQEIKAIDPNLFVITDECFCEYTSHGHCGVLQGKNVDNDKTLVNLVKQVLSHAKAGVDMVAPSGMMDGMIGALREGLDESGFSNLPIMSYAVKYASSYYGPFREAVDSAPSFGDRKTYQMNPANAKAALREASLDVEEGADILMVKPALAYLDIVTKLKENFDLPLAVYNVSGEFAMIKAAAEKGWIQEEQMIYETLLSMKRAGADIIITYHAKEISRILNQN